MLRRRDARALVVDDLAPDDGGPDLALHRQALVGREAGLAVQLGLGQDALGAWVEDDEVAVEPGREVALPTPKAEDLRRIGREEANQVAELDAILANAKGVEEQQGRLDAGDAGADLAEVVDPCALAERLPPVVAADGVDPAPLGPLTSPVTHHPSPPRPPHKEERPSRPPLALTARPAQLPTRIGTAPPYHRTRC